jgi:transglutaminase-like putative cysteine protease
MPIDTELPGLAWLGPPDFGSGRPELDSTMTMALDVLSPQSMLFSVYVPVAVGTSERWELRFDPLTQTLEDVSGHRRLEYTIKADPDPSDATLLALCGRYALTDGGTIVSQFRTLDPRVATLARDVLAARDIRPDPPPEEEDRWAWHAEAAAGLSRYLRLNDRFDYTTDLSDVDLELRTGPEGEPMDPIVQFLLETRRGHCEYFASALAAMCNRVGVPARLVTGYVAGERDQDTGAYIVRESDAHAWVEVQVSPWRWRAFDPTPESGLDLRTRTMVHSLADRWWWLLDRFEARWSDGFVGFDKDKQDRLIDALNGGWSEKLGAALHATQRWMARVNRAFYFGPAGYIWMGIVALAVVIAAIAAGTRMRRAARLRATMHLAGVGGAAYHRMLRQLGFYLDLLEALERSGRPKPGWQPPLQYARALAVRHPEGASLVRQVTELYYGARFGGRSLTRDEVARAEELVGRLGDVMREPAP